MNTTDIDIVGELKARGVALLLIKRSAWFTLEPLPADLWKFTVKAGEGIGELIGQFQRVFEAAQGSSPGRGYPETICEVAEVYGWRTGNPSGGLDRSHSSPANIADAQRFLEAIGVRKKRAQ